MYETEREQLLEALESASAEFDEIVQNAGQENLTRPGVIGPWSIKDIIAHLTAWEERILAWADAVRKGGQPEPPAWNRDWNEDQVNEFIYRRSHDRPLDEVLEHWRAVNWGILGEVRSMSGEQLFGRKIDFLDNTLAAAIPGNSYEHVREHAAAVREWMRKKGL